MITMPDQLTVERYGDYPADQYRYDVAIAGVSHNDATRAAARQAFGGRARP